MRRSNVGLTLVCDGEDCFAPTIELRELVSSPRLSLGRVVLKVGDGPLRVVSFLNGALVTLVDVVMEGVLEGNSVALLGALDSDSESSDD